MGHKGIFTHLMWSGYRIALKLIIRCDVFLSGPAVNTRQQDGSRRNTQGKIIAQSARLQCRATVR